MIEAARPGPGPGREEVLEQGGGQLAELPGTVLAGEAHQQPQLVLLAVVLAAERPLVLEEALDGGFQVLAHPSTSSPSPRATWRSDSTATLA